MSKPQKKLLYNLVNSNEKLKNNRNEGSTVSCLAKRKEWKKIALKLNSITGPQKTWSQWKKVKFFVYFFLNVNNFRINLVVLA